jgi:hypothetical protein
VILSIGSRLLMLNPKMLSGFSAKGRKIVAVPRSLTDTRDQLIMLIDEYWRYYCNPAEYSYVDQRVDPVSGNVTETHIVARWRDMHEIVQHQEGMTIISLFWEGRFLPLTKKGDQEIVLGIATREIIEQILAEIKYAVKIGKLDSHLGHQNTQIASG